MLKTALFIFILSFSVWACPTCAGSANNDADNNTVIILGVFIILSYIPGYLVFRLINKYKDLRLSESGEHPAYRRCDYNE